MNRRTVLATAGGFLGALGLRRSGVQAGIYPPPVVMRTLLDVHRVGEGVKFWLAPTKWSIMRCSASVRDGSFVPEGTGNHHRVWFSVNGGVQYAVLIMEGQRAAYVDFNIFVPEGATIRWHVVPVNVPAKDIDVMIEAQ